MTYYEELVKHVDKSMKEHPHSTVVMDASSFEVIAHGTNAQKVSRKLSRTKKSHGVSVVFQRPSENAVWILAKTSTP